ncbi:MAG: prolipoprotein diacylglyceryl transferase [Bdellovibrionaceae bacterium]|nr:prolipoprotein diacylglyceryl transferase [Pseudobdellovibrionaceae bacterium]
MVIETSGWWPLLQVPVLQEGDAFAIPTYYLIISFAFCVAVIWLSRRSEAAGLPRTTTMDTAFVVMVAGFLGARGLHILYEAPEIYLAEPQRVWRFWEGGFVWYGGALGGFAAGVGFLKWRGWTLGPWLDVFAPIAAGGYALGRVACLLTGCCHGAVCTLASGTQFRYPTQAFAVVWELSTMCGLLWLEKRRTRQLPAKRPRSQPIWLSNPGLLFAVWVLAHGFGRIVMEMFRGDDRGPTLGGWSLSIILSLLAILAAVAWSLQQLRSVQTKNSKVKTRH